MSSEELNRMRWAARRGMLELDLVLEPFVRLRYLELDAQGRQRFANLMICEDQDLFGWFLQRDKPVDAEHVAIVQEILDFTRFASQPS